MRRTETVMTYEDWCKAHRRTLRKSCTCSVTTLIYCDYSAVYWYTVGRDRGGTTEACAFNIEEKR